jgi:hypothetical protein
MKTDILRCRIGIGKQSIEEKTMQNHRQKKYPYQIFVLLGMYFKG